MPTRISVDVDLTIIDENENLLPGVVEGLTALKDRGYLLTLWSYSGEERARQIAKTHKLGRFFEGYATKPDLVIDDDFEALSQLPVIDARSKNGRKMHWSGIARHTMQLAEEIENRSLDNDIPPWIRKMSEDKYSIGIQCSVGIWNRREAYIRWPSTKRLFWPALTRQKDGKSKTCYEYPKHLEKEIEEAGYKVDTRNNGPAIHAYQLSGGDRPLRPFPNTWGWTIHHIYDGTHPPPRTITNKRVPHAASDGGLFTNSAGLVAVHPLADYVAMKEPLLAWLLRWEAFRKFKFDPMEVFG